MEGVAGEEDEAATERPSFWRGALVFATYSMYIWGVSSLPPCYPAMQADLGISSGDTAGILATQTAGAATGKIVAGFIADGFGGRRTYAMAVFALGMGVLLLSFTTTKWQIAVVGFLLEACGSPIWPAHAVIVRGWWPPTLYSDGFWVMSTSSRATDITSKLVYGELLEAMQWRKVLWVATGICMIGLALSTLHKDTPHRKNAGNLAQIQPSAIFVTLKRVIPNHAFWLCVSSLCAHSCIKRLGQLMPVYFFSVAPTLLTHGDAAQLAVVFQVGLLSSVVVAGFFYGRVSDFQKIWLLVSLTSLSVGASFGLAACPRDITSPAALAGVAVLVFLVAFGVGTSYYIPPGVFSVKFGKHDTGVVSALQEVFGMGSAAGFLFVIRPVIDSHLGWQGMWVLVGVTAVVALVLTVQFQRALYLEGVRGADKWLWLFRGVDLGERAADGGQYIPLVGLGDGEPLWQAGTASYEEVSLGPNFEISGEDWEGSGMLNKPGGSTKSMPMERRASVDGQDEAREWNDDADWSHSMILRGKPAHAQDS